MDPNSTATETEESKTETKTDSQDLSEALDKALSDLSDDAPEESAAEAPATETATESKPATEAKHLEAPAEWTTDEKEAFKELNPKSQQAALRLHQSNRADFSRFRQQQNQFAQESATIKALADSVKPFIESTGKQGKNPYQAIQEAVAIVNEIRGNPKLFQALEAARKNGGATPTPEAAAADDKISSVLKVVEELKNEIATERTQKTTQVLGQTFSEVVAEVNGAGERKFPDMDDSPAGIKLAGLVGSTLRSPDFRNAVLARNPNARLRDMIVESYRWHGGRVVDQAVNSGTPQKHIATAKKAAASKPGRAPVSSGPNPKKYKTLSGALDAALADLD